MYLQPSNGKKSKKKKFSLSILPETMDAMATKHRMSVRATSNLAMLLLVSVTVDSTTKDAQILYRRQGSYINQPKETAFPYGVMSDMSL